jgi:transcriptional regulator with XRE-family HTH domain
MDKELEAWYQLHEFHKYSGSYETKDLAEFIGVSERTIQRWLKDKAKPNDKQIAKISKYLENKQSPKEPI